MRKKQEKIIRIAYARRSQKSDKNQVYSIEYQTEVIQNYLDKKNIVLDFFLKESFSGKIGGQRPEFNKILKLLNEERIRRQKYDKYNKSVFCELFVTNFTRICRNEEDGGYIKQAVIEGLLEIYEVESSTKSDKNTPAVLLAIKTGAATDESSTTTRNVNGGMVKQRANGRFCSKAPFGYRNSRDEQNKVIIIPCSTNSLIIQQIYEMFLIKNLTQIQIADYLNKLGIKTREGGNFKTWAITRFLSNPFYCGFFNPKEEETYYTGQQEYRTEKDLTELQKGIHTPIISIETFLKTQFLLKKRPIYIKAEENMDKYLLKSNSYKAKCGKCDGAVTYYLQQGKYPQYKCAKNCFNISARKFEPLIDDILKVFSQISSSMASKIEKELGQDILEVQKQIQKDRDVLENQRKKLEEQSGRALTLLLSGIIADCDYTKTKKENNLKMEEINNQILNLSNNIIQNPDIYITFIELARTLYLTYFSANLPQKKEILEKLIIELIVTPEKGVKLHFYPAFDCLFNTLISYGGGGEN